MQLCVSVWVFSPCFKYTCIYLLCVERLQGPYAGGVGGSLSSVPWGPCPWAEPCEISFLGRAQALGRSERCGASPGRASGPLLLQAWGWASPQNHFQLKRSGNGWTRAKIKGLLGCRCGESRAVRGSRKVRQGWCEAGGTRDPREMLWVLFGPSDARGKPLAVAAGGSSVQC